MSACDIIYNTGQCHVLVFIIHAVRMSGCIVNSALHPCFYTLHLFTVQCHKKTWWLCSLWHHLPVRHIWIRGYSVMLHQHFVYCYFSKTSFTLHRWSYIKKYKKCLPTIYWSLPNIQTTCPKPTLKQYRMAESDQLWQQVQCVRLQTAKSQHTHMTNPPRGDHISQAALLQNSWCFAKFVKVICYV